MKFSRPCHSILLAGLVGMASLPLAAEGEPRFGVEAAVAFPSADLTTNTNNGIELGGIGRWDLRGGLGLTARVDWNFYAQKYGISTSSLGVAADYTFHLTGTGTGPYVLGGLSVLNYSQNIPGADLNSSTLGLDLGFGVDVDRHLGILARWTSHRVSGNTWTVLNLGATYTF